MQRSRRFSRYKESRSKKSRQRELVWRMHHWSRQSSLTLKETGTAYTGMFLRILPDFVLQESFRSIAYYVFGNESSYSQVRKDLMDYLLASREEKWAGIFGTPVEIMQYVVKHRKAGVFGSGKELCLAAQLYGINFILFKPVERPHFIYFSANYKAVCDFDLDGFLLPEKFSCFRLALLSAVMRRTL